MLTFKTRIIYSDESIWEGPLSEWPNSDSTSLDTKGIIAAKIHLRSHYSTNLDGHENYFVLERPTDFYVANWSDYCGGTWWKIDKATGIETAGPFCNKTLTEEIKNNKHLIRIGKWAASDEAFARIQDEVAQWRLY